METTNNNLPNLTAEQEEALRQKFLKEEQDKATQREEQKAAYKTLQDKTVETMVPILLAFQNQQVEIVERCFREFNALVELKNHLYKSKSRQDSHTFTHSDGQSSLRIGYNVNLGFDGTETAGIEKVKEYLTSLAEGDEKRKVLSGLLNTFLKTDKDGKLNPTRIKELSDWKDKVKDEKFREGIEIILAAQVKTRSNEYVRGWCYIPGENPELPKRKVKLSISVEN